MSFALTDKCVKVLVNSKIENLIHELKKVEAIISGTTGPGHLAGVSGRPLIILSESTNPRESAPYVSDIVNIRANLKCSPCYRRGMPNGCGFRCADLISHEDVLDVLKNNKFARISDVRLLTTKDSNYLEL